MVLTDDEQRVAIVAGLRRILVAERSPPAEAVALEMSRLTSPFREDISDSLAHYFATHEPLAGLRVYSDMRKKI